VRHRNRRAGLFLVLLTVVLAATIGATSARSAGKSSSDLRHSGSITVLANSGYNGAWPSGLDPASNTNGAADQSYMSSIFGQLFELGPGGKVVPDLATSYKFSKDAKTITIHLRKRVKFQDGTPFNADAVIWNVKRDLATPCSCQPRGVPFDKDNPVQKVDDHTIQFNLTAPDAAFIHALFDANFSWIASPTAVTKMGADAFKLKPVGAGPFTVVSDTLSSELVLKRNPTYWKKGRPYLSQLTFKSIGGDNAALQAMQAGQAQAYEGLSTPDLLATAKSHFVVTPQLSTSPYDIQLNTAIPPFNDKQARLAIYYATDAAAINKNIFHGLFDVVQGFTAPGGLFYQQNVPGYPAYNLAKAKAIVQQLGGLTVDLGTINVLVANQSITALQTMWEQAGIKVTTHSYDLLPLINAFIGGKWQAMLQTDGSWDPAAGVGRCDAEDEDPRGALREGREVHGRQRPRAEPVRLLRRERVRQAPRRPGAHHGSAGGRRDADHPVGGGRLHPLRQRSLQQEGV
jgi:peptide/nickel transport system substrate-binding protein